MTTSYIGRRIGGEAYAFKDVDGTQGPLPPRLDLANHSPTGFEWGYAGSGPAQLALAILADLLGDDSEARRLYQPFKFERIARLPRDPDWRISEAEVREWIKTSQRAARATRMEFP